jgi:hypothetical protein
MIGRTVVRNGALHVDVEVGMPLTGNVNLAEAPLLMLIGDIGWKHIELFSGVRSRSLVDESGRRVYATFFYVELGFPRGAPMASFGENDGFTIVSTLDFYEEATLDGYHFLYPAGWSEERKVPLTDGEQATALGIPFLRPARRALAARRPARREVAGPALRRPHGLVAWARHRGPGTVTSRCATVTSACGSLHPGRAFPKVPGARPPREHGRPGTPRLGPGTHPGRAPRTQHRTRPLAAGSPTA